MLKARLCVLLLAVFLVLQTGCAPAASVAPPEVTEGYVKEGYISAEGTFTPGAAPEGMELAAQRGYTALYFNAGTADFALLDMRSGEWYFSIPAGSENGSRRERSALVIEDMEDGFTNINTKMSAIARVSAQKTENGFQAWYVFEEERYAVPVEYSLCEDGLRVRVLCDKIQEQGSFKIVSVSVLPFLYAQGEDSDGFILAPDGSGALMRLRGDKSSLKAYSAPLYGDEYISAADYVTSVTENCLLPFMGIQSAAGGLLGMAEAGAAYASVSVSAKGQDSSYAHAGFTFTMRHRQEVTLGTANTSSSRVATIVEKGPIKVKTVSVRYFLLNSTPDTGLAQMAATARAVVRDQAGDIQTAPDSALYLTTLGGYSDKRSVLGFQTTVTEPVATFAQSADMIEKLKKAGADRISLIYTGYERAQLRTGLSRDLTPDKAVGTAAQLQALSAQLGDNRLLLRVDPVTFRRDGGGIRINYHAARDMNLSVVKWNTYKRNTLHADDTRAFYFLKIPQVNALLEKQTAALQQSGSGAGLLFAGLGEMFYGDYSENGYNRLQAVQNAADTLKAMAQKQAVSTVAAAYPAALFSSVITDVPETDSGYDLFDESVPFYQMVFSGDRQLVSRALNTSGDDRRAFLDCLAAGMVPHYELLPEALPMPGKEQVDGFYAADYADWGDAVIAGYQQYLPVYDAVFGQALVNYRQLRTGVCELTYENGTRLLVNRTETAETADGCTVAANGFTLIRAAA